MFFADVLTLTNHQFPTPVMFVILLMSSLLLSLQVTGWLLLVMPNRPISRTAENHMPALAVATKLGR
jgi:hypothetical protein